MICAASRLFSFKKTWKKDSENRLIIRMRISRCTGSIARAPWCQLPLCSSPARLARCNFQSIQKTKTKKKEIIFLIKESLTRQFILLMDYLTATAAWLLWTVAAFTAIRSACSAPYSSVLDEALVKDVLKLSSSACTAEHQDGSFSSTFDHTPSLSPWSQSATREKAKFLAALKHTDPDDPSKNWEMRVGPGGDVYSFRGAYGPNGEMKEVVPPQSTEGTHGGSSAWNDDVFTMVAVDQQRNQNRINGKGWFIHQVRATNQ